MSKIKFCETFFVCLFAIVLSLALCSINFFDNHFIVVVPWILFCFLNDKWYGVISFLSCVLCMSVANKWYFLIMLFLLSSILFFKYLLKYNGSRFAKMINLYNFFVVLVCSAFNALITKNYFFIFFDSVLSYWIMYYFYEIYLVMHKGERKIFNSRQTSFIFCIISLCLFGLNIEIFDFDVSFLGILVLGFVGAKIGFEVGVFYALFVLVAFLLRGNSDIEVSLFLLTSIINLLLANRTNKVTHFFTYAISIFLFLYYFEIGHLEGLEYYASSLIFLLIPNKLLDNLYKVFYGNERYIKYLDDGNKRKRLEMGNKMLRMEEVFSLVCKKFEGNGRIKKCDKELMVEEINVFCGLMENFSKEIKNDFIENRDVRIERAFFEQGVDLVSFEIKEDVLKNVAIKLSVRCEAKEITSLVVPLVNKAMRKNFEVRKKKYNDIFGYYEIELYQNKKFGFQYGVSQRAKDGEVCGDSYLVYESASKFIFALSDGMGAGVEAKRKSKLALDLFKKFMDTGFEVEQALCSLNSVLKGEYDKDSFATLDLLVYDKFEERFCFYKNGASDSFVMKNGKKEVIKGNDLPLGIIDKVQFKASHVDVKKDEVIVMISDGVKENSVFSLDKVRHKKPQVISKELLGKELDIIDDETVIVVKIC